MIKLVAFDLDGTIGDTIPMCLKALKKAVTPYVTLNDVSENDILETFGLNEKGMIKKLVGYNWENALDDFYVIYEQMHIMCPRPFDGITELIEKLKKKSILIALVTGKGEKSCAITLRQFNMDTCFDKVKTGNPFKNNKAENFRELLADYKLQPDEMIYIGDTIINVSFKDEVLMGQLTRSVSVTSGHSATYTVYGVEITEREDDRGNYDSWEENYTFAVTSGSPASRLDSYDRYNGEVSESMTSKEKSFTLVVDGVTVCSNEPISNVGKVDKVIGNYRYIF